MDPIQFPSLTQPTASDSDSDLDESGSPTIITDPSANVAGVESSLKQIRDLALEVLSAINSGKSVTAENKKKIIACASKIIRSTKTATKKLEASKAFSETTQDLGNVVRDVVQHEFQNLRKTLTDNRLPSVSYADAVSRPAKSISTRKDFEKRITKPALIVSHKKENATREELVEAWRKGVSFRKASYAPSRVITMSNNKLKVEFDTLEQRDETIKTVNSTKACDITAEEAKKLKPMIILKGIVKQTPKEELIEVIKLQNIPIKESIQNDDDIQLKFIRKNRSDKLYNAVLTVTPIIWRRIMETQKVNVDHQRVHADEYIPVLQCYKCLRFGHPASKCESSGETCSHCSSKDHRYSECAFKNDPIKKCCINCRDYNHKYQTNRDTAHSATSAECPSMKAMQWRVGLKIDYGS